MQDRVFEILVYFWKIDKYEEVFTILFQELTTQSNCYIS